MKPLVVAQRTLSFQTKVVPRLKFIHDNISKFVEEHVLVEFDVEKIWRERLNKERQAEQESINQASVCSLLPGNDSEWVFLK